MTLPEVEPARIEVATSCLRIPLASGEEVAERALLTETPHMVIRSATPVRVETLDAGLVPVYRTMTPAQRVMAGLSATDLIRDRLHATIRESHPDWTEEAVAKAVSERMLSARI